MVNSTDSFSWSVNYTLPSGCAYTDNTNLTVKCSDGNSRGVTYTFAEINNYWAMSALESCTDIQAEYASCEANSVLSNLSTCLKLSVYNVYQQDNNTPIYGWLSYDAVARNALFGRCESESNGFLVSSINFSAAYTFDFPNIN